MRNIRKILLAVLSGALILQTPGCAETVSAISNALTAGGVLYLVRRVVD